MEHYKFFQNRQCEFFPCHAGVPADSFNCLFCYCPLYALGEDCGGCCTYTAAGIKDCSHCTRPHLPDSYDAIVGGMAPVLALAKKKEKIPEKP